MTSISVIIPAYHNAATLSRTLASLAAQTFPEWDAIIACDGPLDETLIIAQAAARNDARITVLDLSHRGASAARNAGLAVAKGDWLLFLDADYTISPGFMRHMLELAVRNPEADVMACGYTRLDELGRNCGSFAPLPLDRDSLAVCSYGPPGAIHSFIVRRTAALHAGGFDETLKTNEDWDFWLRIAINGSKFAVSQRRLAQYWATANSLTRDAGQMLRDSRVMLERAQALGVRPVDGLDQFDMRFDPIDDLALRNWMWNAGVAIGQGRKLPALFEDVSPTADCRYQKGELALRLYNGLVVGSGTGFAALGQRWPGIRGDVEAFLGQLAKHVGRDDVAGPIARELQLLIACNSKLRGAMDFGYLLAVPLTLRMLLKGFLPQSGADQVVFQLPFRPANWFSFTGPMVGQLTGRDERSIIWRSITTRLERRLERQPLLSPGTIARLARCTALLRRLVDRLIAPDAAARQPDWARPLVTARQSASAPVVSAKPEPVEPHPDHRTDAAGWDHFFASSDPWEYDSAYERIKYERTLSLIHPQPHGHALEIACAEGHFTLRLAPQFGRVTALDISTRAIERARNRTAGLNHIDFVQRDVFHAGLPGEYDCITCSEMLYFAPTLAGLERLAKQIAEALNPGGQFVHAHAFLIAERPDRTAFDWDGTAGGDRIFTIFANTPELTHVRSIVTDLYRIDLFEKIDPAASAPVRPVVETLPIGYELEPCVAADVIWGGAVETRRKALETTTRKVPVLLFHGERGLRKDEDGECFRLTGEQLDLTLRTLRRHGFRSLDMAEWDYAARYSGRIRGKPLVVTFDIFDRMLIENSIVITRRNGFVPHVFATADELLCVAGDERTLRDWIAQGLSIGSRLDGRAPDVLNSREVFEVAFTQRQRLEQLTGAPVRTVAPPKGMADDRITELLRAAGFTRCFLEEGGIAPLAGPAMQTPRLDMAPDFAEETLGSLIGRQSEP